MSRPWIAENEDIDNPRVTLYRVVDAEGIFIAESIEQGDASAIAAAPEMYEALEAVVRVIESEEFAEWEGLAAMMALRSGGTGGYEGEQFMPRVQAALAKARREESTSQTRPLDTPTLDTPTPKTAYRCAGCSYDEPGGFHDPRELRWGKGFDRQGYRAADPNWFCEDCSVGLRFNLLAPSLAEHLDRLKGQAP